MFSQEESVKESIDEQVDDLSDLTELDEEILEVEGVSCLKKHVAKK